MEDNSFMGDMVREIHGLRALVCGDDGPQLSSERDANSLIAAALGEGAAIVVIPTQRMAADFFRLSSRLAGEIIQKFVNYRLRLAIVGDISEWTKESGALRDFIHEANQGRTVWFVGDSDELDRRLVSAAPR